MSKLKAFVYTYSIILLGLFGTFCYLMSIVNPDKIKEIESNPSEPIDELDDDTGLRFEYGLAKVDPKRSNSESNGSTTVSKIILFYRNLQKNGGFVDDLRIVDVVPPTTTPETRSDGKAHRSNLTKPL